MEKSKRLRKAFVVIVKKLPILGAAEGRAKPRNVGRVVSGRKPRRGTYPFANRCKNPRTRSLKLKIAKAKIVEAKIVER